MGSQCPADPHHYSFSEHLLPLAVEKQWALLNESAGARTHSFVVDAASH